MKNKTILIVDDDERNLFALESYFKTHELETVTALNAAQAIILLQSNLNPDVILLDIMMPIMNGYQMLGFIRHTDELKHIPVIVVTAQASRADEQKCREAGAWDYVPKPIDLKILMEKMNRWIL